MIPSRAAMPDSKDETPVDSLLMAFRALLYRRPAEPGVIEVTFDHGVHRVRVRRHRRARRYTLRIDAMSREVVLTMPPRGSLREATAFAQQHGGWIAARIGRLPEPAPFAPGIVIPLRGTPHTIVHRKAARGIVWTETADDGSRLLCVAGAAPHIGRRIGDYLKAQAKADLDEASRRHAAELGVRIKRITVRDQSSRWGSCSTTGALSYSWRLILAPPHILDYLAAHEVAHLVEMNHSPKFWRLVERLVPNVARARVWLDTRGGDLHRYGTAGAPLSDDDL